MKVGLKRSRSEGRKEGGREGGRGVCGSYDAWVVLIHAEMARREGGREGGREEEKKK